MTEIEVLEAIISARRIKKTVRSRHPATDKIDLLYIIEGFTFSGILVYTKGTIRKVEEKEVVYILISSKRSL